MKKVIAVLVIAFFFCAAAIIYADWKIENSSEHRVFDDIDSIPPQKAALVLGTSRYMRSGNENLYFTYRIQAAKKLYDSGKIKAFIVSGDNSTKEYNEPQDMHDALVEQGIPDSIIYLDYAGLRTLDSVVRMKEIFGQDSFIIVSQKFHNQRAIFLANYSGMSAYGYNAKDLELNRASYKTKAREYLARVKVFVDIILNKQPKFLGERVEIK